MISTDLFFLFACVEDLVVFPYWDVFWKLLRIERKFKSYVNYTKQLSYIFIIIITLLLLPLLKLYGIYEKDYKISSPANPKTIIFFTTLSTSCCFQLHYNLWSLWSVSCFSSFPLFTITKSLPSKLLAVSFDGQQPASPFISSNKRE